MVSTPNGWFNWQQLWIFTYFHRPQNKIQEKHLTNDKAMQIGVFNYRHKFVCYLGRCGELPQLELFLWSKKANSDLCNPCGNCSFARIYLHLLDLLFEDSVFLNLGCSQHHVQSDYIYIDHSGVGWVPTTPICQEGDQSLPCGVEAAPWELSRSNTQIRCSIGPASCSSCDNSGWTTISAM